MKVNVRAVVIQDGKLIVSHERRQAADHVLLPGGRVRQGESVHEALEREVREETGVEILADRLLYIAEVVAQYGVHDLILIWSARPRDPDAPIDEDALIPVDSPLAASIMPPVMGEIRSDLSNGWGSHPRWLGNVRRPPRSSVEDSAR